MNPSTEYLDHTCPAADRAFKSCKDSLAFVLNSMQKDVDAETGKLLGALADSAEDELTDLHNVNKDLREQMRVVMDQMAAKITELKRDYANAAMEWAHASAEVGAWRDRCEQAEQEAQRAGAA